MRKLQAGEAGNYLTESRIMAKNRPCAHEASDAREDHVETRSERVACAGNDWNGCSFVAEPSLQSRMQDDSPAFDRARNPRFLGYAVRLEK